MYKLYNTKTAQPFSLSRLARLSLNSIYSLCLLPPPTPCKYPYQLLFRLATLMQKNASPEEERVQGVVTSGRVFANLLLRLSAVTFFTLQPETLLHRDGTILGGWPLHSLWIGGWSEWEDVIKLESKLRKK